MSAPRRLGAVNEAKQIAARPTLQIDAADAPPNVFATGDVVAIPEGCFGFQSGGTRAHAMGAVVAKNVRSLLAGKPLSATMAWPTKPQTAPCISAFGPDDAVADLGLPACLAGLGDALGRKIKSKDFFMGVQGKQFGMGTAW